MLKKTLSFFALMAGMMTISAFTFRAGEQPAAGMEDAVREQVWVDSIFNAMTPAERYGQLVWVRANTDWSDENLDAVARQIEQHQVGGLCFFNPSGKGTPAKQVELTNRFQALTRHVPLFVSIDAEWGIGWRYRGQAVAFPRQMMLGAIQDNTLIYEMGAEIARHCRAMGIHINFAPVADVNNNAANPVINYRSFGEDPQQVALKAWHYMRGMQDNGLMACAKHFPGHGDTDVDSHHDLPVITHSRQRLDSVELMPFKMLTAQGVASVMVAHLQVPALDDRPNTPTTLSRKVVTGILKEEWHYPGLIMTDALEMQGVAKHHGPGEAAAKALAAGNDVLLLPADVEAAIATINNWLEAGKLDSNQVNNSVRKVLRWKYRMGLTQFKPLPTEGLNAVLNDPNSLALRRKLIRHAITLVRNDKDILPFGEKAWKLELGAVAIGAGAGNAFQQRLESYHDFELFQTAKDPGRAVQRKLIQQLKDKDAVVVSLHGMSQRASQNYGLSKNAIAFVKNLNEQVPVVLVAFGNAYSLRNFDELDCVLTTYEDGEDVEDLAAQALFGAFAIQGRLPVTASDKCRSGQGITLPALQRLGYGLPEEAEMSSAKLLKLDTLIQSAIDSQALPGAVILVARQGKIIFNKAWGRHTYEASAPATQTSDIFDLASITKIAATTVSLMRLQDEGRFHFLDPVEKYLQEYEGSNKAGIPLLKMLTHRARLTTWIKFYEATLDEKGFPSKEYYRPVKSREFPWPVAKDLWLRADYPDSIWLAIRESPLLEKEEYRYSDLAFYIAGEIVHRLTGKPVEEYAAERFYGPLGMRHTTYRPYERFSLGQIPPTEEDAYFRHRRIQGYVHDMGAAMLNQATGHAGLFSTSEDLAVLIQMLLNGGSYGGRQYLEPQTIELYASRCGSCTRRGIGFDMLQLKEGAQPNLSTLASENTFGHLGFTGTAAWADPDNEMVFIFLSNRTYPSMFNRKFSEMNVRGKAMDAVYEAMGHLR
ncbi:MAG: beta-N-acetylhexosaminidase [Saprospirales bacterium]|nr:beta-N-acetylhexosaminidase [Saprospirales bacterium]